MQVEGLDTAQPSLEQMLVDPPESLVAGPANGKKRGHVHKRLYCDGNIVRTLDASHQGNITYFDIGNIAYIWISLCKATGGSTCTLIFMTLVQ